MQIRTLLAAALIFIFSSAPVLAAELEPFPVTTTTAELQAKYDAAGMGGPKVKILVMPGHEADYGGALYLDLKEREIAVDIANELAIQLRQNPRFEVALARDNTSWSYELSNYFDDEWKSIEKFVADKKKAMQRMVRRGTIETRDFEPAHNTAATEPALRLYGISKWANEEAYDLAIHIHLNDAADHTATTPGNHEGFAVYVPDHQYGNAAASYALGSAVATELNRYNASSTLPIENYGIVEDQSLIALGAYNTAEFASILVEYGYVYESKFAETAVRDVVTDDFAYQTYLGVQKFFGAPIVRTDDSLSLPYPWMQTELAVGTAGPQVYALQMALKQLNLYPPGGENFYECPVSGRVGDCTKNALKAFQKMNGLTQTGGIGPATLAALKRAGF